MTSKLFFDDFLKKVWLIIFFIFINLHAMPTGPTRGVGRVPVSPTVDQGILSNSPIAIMVW